MPRQHLTPNACLVCRKKRTKCDGERPCRRCSSRGEYCSYEDKRWRTKDHLRSEIDRLQTEQRQDHALLRALTGNDPDRWNMVLDRMRAGDSPETIADWVLGHSSQCFAQAHTKTPWHVPDDAVTPRMRFSNAAPGAGRSLALDQGTSRASLPGPSGHGPPAHASRARKFSFDPQPSIFPPGLCIPPRDIPRRQDFPPLESVSDPLPHTWTKVTSDTVFVQRLLSRFFASSLPYLSLVSPRHFMQDFREGKPRYCSEALVNAVLGMACRVATATSQVVSRVSYGDAFVGEAKRLLSYEHNHDNLPCIQALAILAVAEMSQGNGEAASDLARASVRACVRLVLQGQRQNHNDGAGDDDFRTVRALAYCGGFSLVRLLRLLTGDLEPKTGPLFMRMYPDSADASDNAPEARVERGISLQVRFFNELQYCPPLPRFIFEVTEAAHTFSTYNYSKAMTAEDLDAAFKKCLEYYRQAADLASFDTDARPDVLLAQIWYHFCLLSLLRPFIAHSASLVGGLPLSLSGDATPQVLCRRASEAIISLTSTYQVRHTLACLPPLLPYMVFAAVLHQLSVTASSPGQHQGQQQLVASPEPLSPNPGRRSSYTGVSGKGSSVFHAGVTFAPGANKVCGPEPSSFPPMAMQAPKSAERRNSALSASSTCFSNDDQTRRPSVSSLTSSVTTSHKEGSLSPGTEKTGPDTLPHFASQPADLVALGSLQLISMGPQHTGAAEAAHLLCTVSPVSSTAEPSYPSVFTAVLDAQANLPVGIGRQDLSSEGANYEITSTDTIAGPASVPRFQVTASLQRAAPSPDAAAPEPRRLTVSES